MYLMYIHYINVREPSPATPGVRWYFVDVSLRVYRWPGEFLSKCFKRKILLVQNGTIFVAFSVEMLPR